MKKTVSLVILVAVLLSACVMASGCDIGLGRSLSMSSAQEIFSNAGCYANVSQEEVELAVGEKYTLADTKVDGDGTKTLTYSVQLYGMSAQLVCVFFEDALTDAYIEATISKAGVRQVGKGMADEAKMAKDAILDGSATSYVIVKGTDGQESKYNSVEEFSNAWPSVRIEDVATITYYADTPEGSPYNDVVYIEKLNIDEYKVKFYH